jgi:hypothetical protein
MTQIALGNFLTFQRQGVVSHRFQNFFIGETITYEGAQFGFLPFGFSGVTINKTGDNTTSSLILPNNSLSQSWAIEATNQRWLTRVQVLLLNPDNRTDFTQVHQYWGRAVTSKWDETTITLTLGNILDSVGLDVPVRRLTQNLIGAIPVTSSVRLQ